LLLKRREFLKGITVQPLLAATPGFLVSRGVLVNDVHTGMNPTQVERVVQPTSAAGIADLIKTCRKRGSVISVSGSRHATGGQQFASGSVLVDMRDMNHVIGLDEKSGVLHVQGGIEWPDLVQGYLTLQKENPAWGIRQKQGGGDRMTLGGALSANAHGHGLGIPPIISDIEWIEIVTADASVKKCSRRENAELFGLAIGGYGLFGIITGVGLRLVLRRKLRRRVEVRTLAELVGVMEARASAGAPYGYFQYSIDESSPEFMRTGVLTTYEPVSAETPLGTKSADIDPNALRNLLELAHRNRKSAYHDYAAFELSRDGNVEWSDLHQMSAYPTGYHRAIEKHLGAEFQGADLIVELYVPRGELTSFLEDARRYFLKSKIPLIYGTVRFIERDRDSFLAWARERYACVIFTVHCGADPAAMKKTGAVCRQLMQDSTRRRGSFYLTYNRFATRLELDQAYPRFSDFLNLKKKYDPMELFQSDWYRQYKQLYA
jgi:FAD/FMN-containing dehydrogenase